MFFTNSGCKFLQTDQDQQFYAHFYKHASFQKFPNFFAHFCKIDPLPTLRPWTPISRYRSP